MSTDQLKLLLAPLEVEVVQEALELYVQMRPVPIDHRFEYRYRAARVGARESASGDARTRNVSAWGRRRGDRRRRCATGTPSAP